MKSFITAAIVALIIIACNNSKKLSSINQVDPEKLNGVWVLNYVQSPGNTFDSLYANKKPELNINTADKRVSGNTGCNSFSGPLVVDGSKISFSEPMAMTKMFCPGGGEQVFLENIKKVSSYSTDGKTLNLIMGDIAIMRFSRR